MSGRNRRGHLSYKVPNVKLRPAPALAPGGAGPSQNAGKQQRGRDRTKSPENAMDRELVRRLWAEDGVEDRSAGDVADTDTALSHRPFTGLTICFTGLSTRKLALGDMLRSMGVRGVEPNLSTEVDVLIAEEPGSEKYLSALEYGIEIAMPEWIEELHARWVRGEEVDPRAALPEYRLPAFAGLKIAISGFEPMTRRTEVQSLILSHGGIYSKNLDRTCTHLVIAAPGPDEVYKPSAKAKWAVEQRAALHHPGAGAGDVPEGYIHVVWEGWLSDCVEFAGRWSEARWDVRNGGLGPGPGESMRERVAARKAAEAEARARLAAEPQPLVDLAGVRPVDPLAGSNDVELQPAMIRRAKTHDLIDELFRGYKRPAAGDEAVLAPSTGEAARTAQADTSGVGRKRSRLALVGSQEDAAPPTRSVLHTSRVHAFETALDLDKQVAAATATATASTSKTPRDSLAERAVAQLNTLTPSELFAGLTFSHVVSESSTTMMEMAIRRIGGTLVTESERLRGARVDYVVTRLASGRRPYISPKSHTQVVTECWIERCISANRMFPVDESIVFRPLMAPMPVPDAGSLRIHLSGLTPELTYYSQRLVKAIGATLATVLSKKETTHLLCSTVNRVKFDKAQEWGIPTLQLDWLYDTASTGTIAPTQEYVITEQTAAKLANTPNPTFSTGRLPLASSRTLPIIPVPHAPVSEPTEAAAPAPQDENSPRKASQRKLGLTPTEVDIAPRKANSADASLGLSNAGVATERLLNQVAPATRELVKTVSVPSNPFKVVAEDKTRTSVPLLTSEIMQRLDQEAEQAVDRRTRQIRRPRPVAPRKNSDTRSILAPRDPSEYEAPIEQDVEDVDTGDQSIRVTYNDPVAEKERKRIMDAIVRPTSAASSASGRSKKARR